MSWQARQVVQAQMTSRPMVSTRLAAGSVKAVSPIWLTSRMGDNGLPVAKAGQRSWQRLHRVQASASKRSFQRRSAISLAPNFSVDSSSRLMEVSLPVGPRSARKALALVVRMWRNLL